MESCYETLGVPAGSDLPTVRAAYHKLALQLHPDKSRDPVRDQARFIEIKEAYSKILQKEWSADKKEDGSAMQRKRSMDWVSAMIWAMFAMIQGASVERTKPVQVVVPITLEDLYQKTVKKMRVKVKRWNAETFQLVEYVEPIYLSLLNYELMYKLENLGDDGPFGTVRSDMHILLDIKTHPTFRVMDVFSPYDLSVTIPVNLLQYYYGVSTPFTLFHLSGETIRIPYLPGEESVTMHSYGLPYYNFETETEEWGDLYVYFELQMPPLSKVQEHPDIKRALERLYLTSGGGCAI